MLVSGKFLLMATGFLILYTAYVNLGYVRFMEKEIYNVYLYDPEGIQINVSPLVQSVPTREALDAALLEDTGGVGLSVSSGDVQVVLYEATKQIDRHRADYALSLLHPSPSRILFVISKLAVFLLSDLCYAVLLTLVNVGLSEGTAVLPAVLIQTAILSLVMALTGLLCALLLKDFRQFTLAYLLIAVFAASPVFLSANTAVKFDWIGFHPFYHFYMGLKDAYFGMPIMPGDYTISGFAIMILFFSVQLAFRKEMGKEG